MTLIALPLMLWLAAAQAEPVQPAPVAAEAPPTVAAPAAPASAAPTVQAAPAPRPANLNDARVAPDGPLSDADRSYQNRVLGSFNATQGRQGAFDGRWTVSGSAGDMFVLQLSDPGDGKIEGAWRDVRRVGGGKSGLIDSISREGDHVVVNFIETQGGTPVEVRLRSPQPGGWLGEATTPEGGRQSVVMHRAQGLETQAAEAPRVWQPPPPRAKVQSTSQSPKSAKAKKGRQSASQRRGRATAASHSPKKQHSTSKSASKGKKSTASSSKKKSTASATSSKKKSTASSSKSKSSSTAKKKPATTSTAKKKK